MKDDPLFLSVMIGFSLYLIHLWRSDYIRGKNGEPHPQSLPGATPAPLIACIWALAGSWLLLAIETYGEIKLGVSDEQSTVTWLFGFYSLCAGVIEEIIFRGYLVVRNRGKIALWSAIFAASLLFALLHPFLWNFEAENFFKPADWIWEWHFDTKGWFSTIMVFIGSLWFYTVRFASFNPRQSLLPCFTAHVGKNLGVIIIKAFQGFVGGFI